MYIRPSDCCGRNISQTHCEIFPNSLEVEPDFGGLGSKVNVTVFSHESFSHVHNLSGTFRGNFLKFGTNFCWDTFLVKSQCCLCQNCAETADFVGHLSCQVEHVGRILVSEFRSSVQQHAYFKHCIPPQADW